MTGRDGIPVTGRRGKRVVLREGIGENMRKGGKPHKRRKELWIPFIKML